MITLPCFSQLDPQWGNDVIPTASGTITLHSDGCYITSLTAALWNYEIQLTPDKVLAALVANGGINAQGWVTYDGVERAFPSVCYSERVYTKNDPSPDIAKMETAVAIEKVKKYLKLGQPVILSVYLPVNQQKPNHAVCCYDWDGQHFWIMDPDGGRQITFDSRYGDPLTNLYGYVALIGPPIAFPKDGYPGLGSALWKIAKFYKDNWHKLNNDATIVNAQYVKEAKTDFTN